MIGKLLCRLKRAMIYVLSFLLGLNEREIYKVLEH
jgi:hypothetical protein